MPGQHVSEPQLSGNPLTIPDKIKDEKTKASPKLGTKLP